MTTTQSTSSFGIISPQEVAAQKQSVLLLDVRTPAEFEESHIDGAVLHPITELNPGEVARLSAGKRETVVICRSGGRARQAAEKLVSSSLPSVRVMEGGMQAWELSGLPVVQGRRTISLERQVRIAAGALTFIGAALGYFVNPAWIGLSAFVGAGLMFAGITDTCGMALVLARMPWNNRGSSGKRNCCAT
jgi:rhodanese-related sulfurtransferase